ncbi:polyprenyl synthetase family protein [Microbacterium amylolyticum]|uniref:Geranylgeranyl diphosphate synthase type I n=1 Tax=Microbacterium amylolyticum TaxID=936337 RepID=A0ABS4ZFE1_9MICO|nr:polyprenyl synthetase family protein [Microbacterium amylolyticum]MBP2436003.1 geranylgeranyl diphosphate synthase type I [Microbacterium amylolyticum]
MRSPHDIITAVSEVLEAFVSECRKEILDDPIYAGAENPDVVATALIDHAAEALRGGKRLRARFAFSGWRAVYSQEDHTGRVTTLGAALEVFQAAALVHDDIVDNSDTRRGRPAMHRAFESVHRAREWHGASDSFGRSGAILLGDLLLGWSDDLLERAISDADAAAGVRALYARMRRDVILGQFLDIAEESAWPTIPDREHATRALRIATLKSARYSVQQPLLLGAVLGGARSDQIAALESFGHPLGIAFQLRDDVLGVFGDESVTGKPSGDDLREGKRTLLIAYAREAMTARDRAELDQRLGASDLTRDEIVALQQAIRDTGALDRVETLITESASQADAAIDSADIDAEAATQLRDLTTAATRRSA